VAVKVQSGQVLCHACRMPTQYVMEQDGQSRKLTKVTEEKDLVRVIVSSDLKVSIDSVLRLLGKLRMYFDLLRDISQDWIRQIFYRVMLRRARSVLLRQVVSPSVCPSVCPSVTLRYRDHIGSSSPLVSLWSSLSTDPNSFGLLEGKHPEILAEQGWDIEKAAFSVQKL